MTRFTELRFIIKHRSLPCLISSFIFFFTPFVYSSSMDFKYELWNNSSTRKTDTFFEHFNLDDNSHILSLKFRNELSSFIPNIGLRYETSTASLIEYDRYDLIAFYMFCTQINLNPPGCFWIRVIEHEIGHI